MFTDRKKFIALAFTFFVGIAAGAVGKDLLSGSAGAQTSTAKPVAVKLAAEPTIKVNSLIGPDLWRVNLDPFFVPVDLAIAPLAIPDFVTPAMDVPEIKTIESDQGLQVIAKTPGLTDKDIEVEVGKDSLTIKGHKKEVKNDNGKHFATMEESFVRTVRLPCAVRGEKVRAVVKDGVLTVSLPKS